MTRTTDPTDHHPDPDHAPSVVGVVRVLALAVADMESAHDRACAALDDLIRLAPQLSSLIDSAASAVPAQESPGEGDAGAPPPSMLSAGGWTLTDDPENGVVAERRPVSASKRF